MDAPLPLYANPKFLGDGGVAPRAARVSGNWFPLKAHPAAQRQRFPQKIDAPSGRRPSRCERCSRLRPWPCADGRSGRRLWAGAGAGAHPPHAQRLPLQGGRVRLGLLPGGRVPPHNYRLAAPTWPGACCMRAVCLNGQFQPQGALRLRLGLDGLDGPLSGGVTARRQPLTAAEIAVSST